ncbi:MAG: endo-1,4-beta-xylanase [Candidatus Sumerlaeota bacterium]|nr:endo-1,4-beta-xylanase [Candidatus Sumerlaeota bacterium]
MQEPDQNSDGQAADGQESDGQNSGSQDSGGQVSGVPISGSDASGGQDISSPNSGAALRYFPWLELCVLLAAAQIMYAGYQFGVGNQGVQIAFLKRVNDPSTFPNDPMVGTIAHYPSFFFQILSFAVSEVELQPLYFWLHCLTAFGVFAGAYWLGVSIYRRRAAGLIAALLLAAGHHQALASTSLYWQGFTHTWAVFPLAIIILALFYQERYWIAFLLTGALFNLHALTAAYLFAMLGAWIALEWRNLKLPRIAACAALGLLAASPGLYAMLGQSQTFDAEWIRLTRIRSSQHSFPFSWWAPGNPEIPRFLLMAALAALALSFPMPNETWRKTRALALGVLALFALGIIGSEITPVAAVIRAQVFRSSGILLLLMLVVIANGVAEGWAALGIGVWGWRILFRSPREPFDEDDPSGQISFGRRRLEWIAATATFLTLAIPALIPLLPAIFALNLLTALLSGRLGKAQAAFSGVVFILCLAAWRQIHFSLAPVVSLKSLAETFFRADGGWLLVSAPSAAIAVALLASCLPDGRPAWRALTLGLRCGAVAAAIAFVTLFFNAGHGQSAPDAIPWLQAQLWAKEHTPPDTVFLTPALPGGFRLYSDRPIVSEWRDGTQQYFDAAYAKEWWRRMQDLQPGAMYDASGERQLSRGRNLNELDDNQLAALCKKYGVHYFVLPKNPDRDFVKAYENSEWAIYRDERKPPPAAPPPTATAPQATASATSNDAATTDIWQAQLNFMKSVVQPNIEKYRKSSVTLQFVDAAGRPLRNATAEIHQTDSLFRFGSCLHHFEIPTGYQFANEKPGLESEKVLALFPQIFNFSVIGYSGKWVTMEPEPNKPFFGDLDKYVDWCEKNKVEVQYHFITGYEPHWLRGMSGAERQEHLLRHTRELVERYGARIATWQVVNEKHAYAESPAVFELARKLNPKIKLGISDCAAPYAQPSMFGFGRARDMDRGLLEQARWLKSKGIKVDFVGLHCHRPRGLWADMRTVYDLVDMFAKEDIRSYITEFGVTQSGQIEGPVRSGQWSEDLQAEYYELFYTTCFSHPWVDAIDLWGFGPRPFVPGAGLLDRNFDPKPVYHRLKKLITETWRTNQSGEIGADGAVALRGFHGDYEVTIKLKLGEAYKARFTLRPDSPNAMRIMLGGKN